MGYRVINLGGPFLGAKDCDGLPDKERVDCQNENLKEKLAKLAPGSNLGQATQADITAQITTIQKEIETLCDSFTAGTVDPKVIENLQTKLSQCGALGTTPDALKCLVDLREQLKSVHSSTQAPTWPLVVGGLAAAGVAGYFLFVK